MLIVLDLALVHRVWALWTSAAALFVVNGWLMVLYSAVATGPSTKVLNSLVSKIRQYPQLTDHCMRLRAFIMGLLK